MSHNQDAQPKVKGDAWEIVSVSFWGFPHCEFNIMAPKGDFYLRRVLQDDLRPAMTQPGTLLDVTLMIYRVIEVFAVGLAVAKSTGWAPDGIAGFNLRWSGLAGRSLGAWANPIAWDISGSGTAHDMDASSFVDVPLDTPASALEPYIFRAIGPLFSKFDGYVAEQALVEACVRKVVERKMN